VIEESNNINVWFALSIHGMRIGLIIVTVIAWVCIVRRLLKPFCELIGLYTVVLTFLFLDLVLLYADFSYRRITLDFWQWLLTEHVFPKERMPMYLIYGIGFMVVPFILFIGRRAVVKKGRTG